MKGSAAKGDRPDTPPADYDVENNNINSKKENFAAHNGHQVVY